LIEIERAAAGDAAELGPLFDAYRQFFTRQNALAASTQFLRERLERDECVVFVGRQDERAIGFVQLYPLWSSWYCKRIWFLSDLYVAENARLHGAGRLLVERVKVYALETDASSVMVELPLSEPHLREFYARLGFVADPVFALARFTTNDTH
jgi:GNAT superfamily N-acetyltransferase